MQIKPVVNPKDFEVGVLIARFQVDELHEGHIQLIDEVVGNHSKVILFLGVAVVQDTKRNPLDFASRKAMVQSHYPDIIILPLNDQRDNQTWSTVLDSKIKEPFGQRKTVLYGSKDSFIPYYFGKYPTIELQPTIDANATDIRDAISKRLRYSSDFRAGIIHSTYTQRPVTYPTVDIVVGNEKGEILLGRKPAETKFRFIGGFVDRTDESYEAAAHRELNEETGLAIHKDLKYMFSHKVDDWRYAKEESGIMTTLFLGKYFYGPATAGDDIAQVDWISVQKLSTDEAIERLIMPEHQSMMKAFINKVYAENLIIGVGERLVFESNRGLGDGN